MIVTITTSGDRAAAPGDKSRFVKEIDEALLAGEVDLAVHSAKDVPGQLPDGAEIAAVPAGEDPRDALVGSGSTVDELRRRARVGTSSLRRTAQLLAAGPALRVLPLRGNVDTRLRKLADGEYDAIVLALAGLRRLGRDGGAQPLDVQTFVPAPGQGLLALQTRTDDPAKAAVVALEDVAARARLTAERAIVEELGASCHTPVGAHAVVDGDSLTLHAFVGLPDGSEWITDRLDARADDPAPAGRELARRMIAAGAAELLRRCPPHRAALDVRSE